MACPPDTPEFQTDSEAPITRAQIFLVERNYRDLGCDRWTSHRVRRLCHKLTEPYAVVAARMRIRPSDFARRLEQDCWTKQDGLILTIIEREVDFLKGGTIPPGRLVTNK